MRAELTKVSDRVRQSVMRLDTEEHRAWAKDEFEFIEHVLESTSEVVDADVDFVLRAYTPPKPWSARSVHSHRHVKMNTDVRLN